MSKRAAITGSTTTFHRFKTAQVVFLIDASVGRQAGIDAESVISALQLSTIRLLSHFEHSDEYKVLRWGYKFYKLDSLPMSTSRHSAWKDFNTSNFKVFEEMLESSVRRELNLAPTPKKRPCQSPDDMDPMQMSPVQSYANVLRAVIEDFQWEIPDISSPVKRGKCQSGHITENYVFNFHLFPASCAELASFVGYAKCEKSVQLLNLIMSDIALRRWKAPNRRMHLFWIRPIMKCPLIEATLASMYKRMLVQLGGKLLHMHDFTDGRSNPGTKFNFHKPVGMSSIPVKFSDIVSAQIRPDNASPSRESCHTLCRRSDDCELLELKLKPVHDQQSLSTEMDVSSRLMFTGLLPKQPIPLTALDPLNSFLCTSNCRELWENLLIELSSADLVMIVSLGEHVGILQPLSCTSATLTLVKPEHESLISDAVNVAPSHWIFRGCDKSTRGEVRHTLLKFLQSIENESDKSPTDPDTVARKTWSRMCNRPSVFGSTLRGELFDPWYNKPNGPTDKSTDRKITETTGKSASTKLLSDISSLASIYRTMMLPSVLPPSTPASKPIIVKRETGIKKIVKVAPIGSQQLEASIQQRNLQRRSLESEVKQEKEVPKTKKKISLTMLSNIDFKDKDGLLAYIKKSYEEACCGKADVCMTSQSIVSITHHFHKNDENSVSATHELLKSKMLRTIKEIRTTNRTNPDRKCRECQIQTLLLLEMEALKCQQNSPAVAAAADDEDEDEDDIIAELVSDMSGLLTTMSMGTPEQLTTFLNDTLLPSYWMTLPKILGQLFIELGQGEPACLQKLKSPKQESTTVETLHSSVDYHNFRSKSPTLLSCTSLLSEDSQSAWATRSFQQRSRSDIGSRRSIAVPGGLLKKTKRRSSRTTTTDGISSRTRSRTPGKKPVEFGTGFLMGLDTKANATVMRAQASSSKRSKVKRDLFASPSTRKSPRKRHSTGACSAGLDMDVPLVAETPVHKQGRTRMSIRSATMPVQNDTIVEESPAKTGFDLSLQNEDETVTDEPFKRFRRRTSFYDVDKFKSRNLAKFEKLENRMKCALGTDKCTPRRLTQLIFKEAITSPSQKISSRITPTTVPVVPESPTFAERKRHSRGNPSQASESLPPLVVATPQKNNLKKQLFKSPMVTRAAAEADYSNIIVSEICVETPVKCTPTKSTTRKHTPVKSTPNKSTPRKHTPVKSTPNKSTPRKHTPVKSTPNISTPRKHTPAKSIPNKSTPRKHTPLKSMPAKATPQKHTPVKSTCRPSKGIDREDASCSNIAPPARPPSITKTHKHTPVKKTPPNSGRSVLQVTTPVRHSPRYITPTSSAITPKKHLDRWSDTRETSKASVAASPKSRKRNIGKLLKTTDSCVDEDKGSSPNRKKIRLAKNESTTETAIEKTCPCGMTTPKNKGRKSPLQTAASCNSQARVCQFTTHNTPPHFSSPEKSEVNSPTMQTPSSAVASFHRRKSHRSPRRASQSDKSGELELLTTQQDNAGIPISNNASSEHRLEMLCSPRKQVTWSMEGGLAISQKSPSVKNSPTPRKYSPKLSTRQIESLQFAPLTYCPSGTADSKYS